MIARDPEYGAKDGCSGIIGNDILEKKRVNYAKISFLGFQVNGAGVESVSTTGNAVLEKMIRRQQ